MLEWRRLYPHWIKLAGQFDRNSLHEMEGAAIAGSHKDNWRQRGAREGVNFLPNWLCTALLQLGSHYFNQ